MKTREAAEGSLGVVLHVMVGSVGMSWRWLGCGGVGWDVSWRFLCCSCHLAFTGKCQQVCRGKTDV